MRIAHHTGARHPMRGVPRRPARRLASWGTGFLHLGDCAWSSGRRCACAIIKRPPTKQPPTERGSPAKSPRTQAHLNRCFIGGNFEINKFCFRTKNPGKPQALPETTEKANENIGTGSLVTIVIKPSVINKRLLKNRWVYTRLYNYRHWDQRS